MTLSGFLRSGLLSFFIYFFTFLCVFSLYIAIAGETKDRLCLPRLAKTSENLERYATVAAYFKYVTFLPHVFTLTG